jgi:hypothetical protein
LTLSGWRGIRADALAYEHQHRAFPKRARLDKMTVGAWLHQRGIEHLMPVLAAFGITQTE